MRFVDEKSNNQLIGAIVILGRRHAATSSVVSSVPSQNVSTINVAAFKIESSSPEHASMVRSRVVTSAFAVLGLIVSKRDGSLLRYNQNSIQRTIQEFWPSSTQRRVDTEVATVPEYSECSAPVAYLSAVTSWSSSKWKSDTCDWRLRQYPFQCRYACLKCWRPGLRPRKIALALGATTRGMQTITQRFLSTIWKSKVASCNSKKHITRTVA